MITLDQQWRSVLKNGSNLIGSIRSKIGLKIGILVVIQIGFVISSFSILSYYESQDTHLGNSINIAGKNRFLTSNLMLELSEYFSQVGNGTDLSKISSAMNQLESNILKLKQGGMISDIDLRPLPSKFLEDWNKIYQEWVYLKTILTNTIIQPNGRINNAEITPPTVEALQATTETSASSLLNSSNVLVTELGEYARVSSQNSMMLQGIFAVLNIAVAAVVLYLVMRILKPVFALTAATSEIGKGNLDVSVKGTGSDELSVLGRSFNSMVESLKSYIKKQNELTKELECNANEELKHKDRLKDEFINVAAHELRTPIQPILGLTEYLHSIREGKSRSIPITVQQEDLLLDIILRNSKRLMQLTEDILDATKIESGSLILKKEKFDLDKMIIEILNEYRQSIKNGNRSNLAIHYECQGDGATIIVADRSRLCQVVNNLISNAFKFTNDGRIKVTVEQKESSNKIIVKIKDTGTGIHPDILPKLFTKFGTKSDGGGTGVGLFISKSIIEKHGGSIWAENNNYDGDVGATFTFSLPIDTNKK